MEIDEDTLRLTGYCRSPSNNTVVETIDVSEYPTKSKRRTSNVYDKELCKDNKLFTDFINKCIFLDKTDGMEKIINKVLLPAYVKADTVYKKSDKFIRVVTKALQRLTNDPNKKYTHISDVVDTLKFHAATANVNNNNLKPVDVKVDVNPVDKKRVNFVTLSTKVSGEYFDKPKENRKRPIIQSTNDVSPKKSKPAVIALDIDDDDDDDDDEDDIIPIDNDNQEDVNHDATEEDNLANGETIEIEDSQELKIIEETQSDETETENAISELNDKPVSSKITNNEPTINEIEHEKENLGSNENLNDENKLLVLHKERIVRLEKPKPKKKEPAEMTEEEKAKRIKAIEATIEKYNNTITKLDLEEVVDDSANSPYYKRDRLQAMIVKLYKELCTLVGEAAPKRRKIRFHVEDGVPKGPIKRLEKFLNKRADADGVAPFPDFSDVVRCVERANEKDSLGWSKAKVMEEAQALFTYCGRALQKKRQKREWKHLRSQVRPEAFEADPAEADPELRARLEANRRLARQREAEVFSKFTRMQTEPPQASATSLQSEDNLHIQNLPDGEDLENPSEADSSSDEEPAEPTSAPEQNRREDHNAEYPEVPIVEQSDNDAPVVVYPDAAPVVNHTDITVPVVNNTDITVPVVNHTDITAPVVNHTDITAPVVNHTDITAPVAVKQEPVHVQYKGDISLVIEISDSESDDDEIGDLAF